MAKTAGIVIIGNEVLSGKTQDTNSHFLCRELRSLGVNVCRIGVIPDEIELIGAEVARFARAYDYVFTTGGVGPTHDDVTIAGIARGFGVEVVRHPELEARLRARHGDNLNEARLRMAQVPAGAELIATGSIYGPVVKFRNVYIFPGIPRVMRENFAAIKERFRDAPFYLKLVYVKEGEGAIAAILNDLLARFPDLMLGSYPVLDNPDYRVKVTLESKDAAYVEAALKHLIGALPAGAISRVEDG
ncbi:MAG TPA: molybdopterin-binding protein [Candidatus Acidoferrales bacterium]|nr:molybdopterin-binding protein [Candidatus Acidoferrales bacterium]